MKKRIIYGCVALVIIVAIVILIKAFGSSDDSHVIDIPSPVVESGEIVGKDEINRVEVSAETVKAVLETLARAENFSRNYKIKTLWDGGESESSLSYWQKGSNIRIRITQNKSVRNILVLGNELYVWYDGSSGIFKSKLAESSVSRELDKFAGLVTYEDIMEAPQEDILSASYDMHSGQPCIVADYKSGELNYVNRIFVSIDSGLLLAAEKYDGDTLVYSMEFVSIDLSTPPNDVFAIPS